jgi:hypothetical protein
MRKPKVLISVKESNIEQHHKRIHIILVLENLPYIRTHHYYRHLYKIFTLLTPYCQNEYHKQAT